MPSDDDLFASDSDDTADLIASTKQATSTATKAKKKPLPKKPASKKANESDSDDDDGKGLFDSDSEDDQVKAKISKPKKAPALSKREKLEALARKKAVVHEPASSNRNNNNNKQKNKNDKNEKGYDSADSYDSADFERTKEDDDFLDTTGEDAEAMNELYAEQHFDDERPLKEKKKRKNRSSGVNGEAIEDNGPGGEPDNPVMAAVYRMKKKKREKKTFTEIEDECKIFLDQMERAAEQDEQSIKERIPATKKLAMLNAVVDMLTRKDMQRMLLDLDLLAICKRWIQPLPNGQLGNLTVRQRLLEVVGNMTGETGITANDLKRSDFGKVVMLLFKHPQETPAMKRQLKNLIEQWSRPIFQKSGNMRDLERVQTMRGEGSLTAYSRQQAADAAGKPSQANSAGIARVTDPNDIQSMIATGKKSGSPASAGVNRVRVPFSRGFNFTVRPTGKADMDPDKRASRPAAATDSRGKLSKRMTEKGRPVSKNQRSANISVEGRRTKG